MSFFFVLVLFMHVVIIFASTTNGIFQIENYYKAALPSESVHFDINLYNNEVNRETFLIYPVWENSVLWLPMDLVDNQVYDFSSFRNHGTIYGASWVDGKVGDALQFAADEEYVEIPYSSSLSTTDITIDMWYKPQGLGHIADKRSWDSGNKGWFIRQDSDGTITFEQWNGGGSAAGSLSSSGFEYGVFHHLTCVFKAGEYIKIFKNGVEVASKTSAVTGVCDGDSKLCLGTANWGAPPDWFDGVIDEVHIFNRALTAEEVGWLYNNSWSESLSTYTVELESGESTQMTFRARVPDDARAGYIQKFLLTAFPLSNPEAVETQTVTVEVLPKYGVELSLDENEKTGKPGEILNFQAVIRNLGNIEDAYDLSVEGGEEWNLSLSAESITVPAEDAGSFNVTANVLSDALPGDYMSFRIQAASRGKQNLTTNVNGTAIATATYRFNITTDPQLRQVSPGLETIFSLELKNLGTAPDTIGLEVESLIGWDIKVDPTSLSLEIGETGNATVHVSVQEDALIGQTSTITIYAVSSGDPTVSANSSIAIEVVTPFWDIPDVRFLVGLSIGVLVGATLIITIIFSRMRARVRIISSRTKINRKENRRS